MGQTLDESIRYYTECKVLTFREKCDPLAAVGKEIHRLFQRPVRGPSRSIPDEYKTEAYVKDS